VQRGIHNGQPVLLCGYRDAQRPESYTRATVMSSNLICGARNHRDVTPTTSKGKNAPRHKALGLKFFDLETLGQRRREPAKIRMPQVAVVG
jgi:hypothetical protein